MPKKVFSQQCKLDKVTKILEFVQKIFSINSLFFNQKNSSKDIDIPQSQKGIDTNPKHKLFAESSLQEYFAEKFLTQLIIKNVKSVPDLILNPDLIMNKLSLKSNSKVKEYQLGYQFHEKLKRWSHSFSFHKKTYSRDDD